MLFNSIEFLIFFPLVTILYFLLPHRFRWLHLLIASCVFYMAFIPVYIVILGCTIIVDYFAGIWIEQADQKWKKTFLSLSIVVNVGILAVFKYYNFFTENVNQLLTQLHVHAHPLPLMSMLLPIGLSFHTFQAMSYTIEVYRGNQKAEKHFGIYALYVMFYPQLVAGPIERPQNILHQFREKHAFEINRVMNGLQLMTWGLFKKLVIADRLGAIVDQIYDNPAAYSGWPIFAGLVFFAFQIYCDFSGYSDIALGSARVMGFELMKNFDRPFSSKNITEFWRRWHISLSTWFNDYLFTPFAVKYRDWGKAAVVTGLMMTFLLSGLWHGAGWTFIIFGGLHGLALVYEFLSKKWRKNTAKKIPKPIYDMSSTLLTFLFLIFSWVFFRATSLHNVLDIFTQLGHASLGNLPMVKSLGVFSILIAFVMLLYSFLVEKNMRFDQVSNLKNQAIFNIANLSLIVTLGVFDQKSFIYFQF